MKSYNDRGNKKEQDQGVRGSRKEENLEQEGIGHGQSSPTQTGSQSAQEERTDTEMDSE